MSKEEDKKRLVQRLRRVEGQVRGIQRMIEEEKDCMDILVQVAAARAALDKVGLGIFEGHSRSCILRAVQDEQGEQAIDELMGIMTKFMK